jgi:hypothetical protein
MTKVLSREEERALYSKFLDQTESSIIEAIRETMFSLALREDPANGLVHSDIREVNREDHRLTVLLWNGLKVTVDIERGQP